MLTIAAANVKGIISESLSDPNALHHRAYRVTCTMCGAVEEFIESEKERGTALFERYMLYKIAHRKQHPLTTPAKADSYGTEAMF